MKLIQYTWKHPFRKILKEKESLEIVQCDVYLLKKKKSHRKAIIQVIKQYKSREEKN